MGIGTLRRYYPQKEAPPVKKDPNAEPKPVVEVSDKHFVKRTEVPHHIATDKAVLALVKKEQAAADEKARE